jgi:hypothetical protein
MVASQKPFRDAHPLVLAGHYRAAVLAKRGIGCKQKHRVFASLSSLLTSLSEIHATKFPKKSKFFELFRSRWADATQRPQNLPVRSADPEADVADGFGAEALF